MNHSVSSFASRHRTPSFYPSTFCTLPVVLCIVLQQVLVIVCLLFQLCERARFPGFLYCCTGSYLHLFTLLLTRYQHQYSFDLLLAHYVELSHVVHAGHHRGARLQDR